MGTTNIPIADAGPTVADVMLAEPDTFGPGTTVADARRAFESPKQKLVVLADGGHYIGAITRLGIAEADDDTPLTDLALNAVPTLAPTAPTDRIFEIVTTHDLSRIPVVDDHGTLHGLVCFNRTRDTFCVA